jgi:hypothetical protein
VTIVIEAYGARLALSVPDEGILERIIAGLPAGWRPDDADDGAESLEWRFAITRDGREGYLVRDGNGVVSACEDLDIAIGLLRLQLRRFVGHHAHDLIFVHAGAVAHKGRGIIMPGHSFSGKSTLAAALVRAGAAFYSDEYAVLGEDGLLQPYREPLVLREPGELHRPTFTAEELGGEAGEDPVPVGLVVITTYRPGGSWSPRLLSTAQGVLAMMEHAIAVRERPEQTMGVLRRALESAEILEGERGESDDLARALLADF